MRLSNKKNNNTLVMGSAAAPQGRPRTTMPMPMSTNHPTASQLLSEVDVDVNTDDFIDADDVHPYAWTQPSLPPVTPPRRPARQSRQSSQSLSSSSIAPVSNRFESQWFSANGSAPVDDRDFARSPAPLMADLDERRGWQPPKTSRAIAFTVVSLLLVGIAVSGTVFLVGDSGRKSQSVNPISTTTITNADAPPAPALATPPPPTDPTTEPSTQRTITVGDLPTAAIATPPPQPDAFGKATPTTTPPAPQPRTTHTTPPVRQRAAAAEPPMNPPSDPSRAVRGGLPDLDRAAAATGMTPAQQDDTSFSTPAPAAPPPAAAAATDSAPTTPTDSAPTTPAPTTAPSEAAPDLQLKR